MDAKKDSKRILVRVSRDKIRRTKLFVKAEKTSDGTVLTLSDGLTAEVDKSGTRIKIYNLEVVNDDDSPVTEKKLRKDDIMRKLVQIKENQISANEVTEIESRDNSSGYDVGRQR